MTKVKESRTIGERRSSLNGTNGKRTARRRTVSKPTEDEETGSPRRMSAHVPSTARHKPIILGEPSAFGQAPATIDALIESGEFKASIVGTLLPSEDEIVASGPPQLDRFTPPLQPRSAPPAAELNEILGNRISSANRCIVISRDLPKILLSNAWRGGQSERTVKRKDPKTGKSWEEHLPARPPILPPSSLNPELDLADVNAKNVQELPAAYHVRLTVPGESIGHSVKFAGTAVTLAKPFPDPGAIRDALRPTEKMELLLQGDERILPSDTFPLFCTPITGNNLGVRAQGLRRDIAALPGGDAAEILSASDSGEHQGGQ